MGSIASAAYRVDRSYAWNYAHAPALPRVRRIPPGPGHRLFDRRLNSPLGIAAGPLLNARWVEAYATADIDLVVKRPHGPLRTAAAPVVIAEPARDIAETILSWDASHVDVHLTTAGE